ncbi:hypothetical protein DPX16_17095 [Anabarilius grahami]|uniref:Uncharacterized protein n=1 Tax=Anabarilius grahami TaxID=495550 RepID=A0A3N0YB13_ANAGA|nr:hypothetical protein DPX16_17095 [Anabarilius grahami]
MIVVVKSSSVDMLGPLLFLFLSGHTTVFTVLDEWPKFNPKVIHCTSIHAAAQSLGKSGGNITGLECRPTYLEPHENVLDNAPIPARHTSSKPLMLAGLGVHNVAGPLVGSEVLRFTDILVPVSGLLQSSSYRLALNTRPHLLSEIPLYPSICCST